MAIRNSARAILFQEGKVLAVKYQDERGIFYAFTGVKSVSETFHLTIASLLLMRRSTE